MITRIYFLSEAEAVQLEPTCNRVMVSVTVPYKIADIKEDGWAAPVLRLQFHDIDMFTRAFTLFNEEHAAKIINWLEEYISVLSGNVMVLVHCHAGISRSAAIAKFIADWAELKNFNHKYTLYNKHVYSMLQKTYWERVTRKRMKTTILGELSPFVPAADDSEEHKKKLERIQKDFLDARWKRLGGKEKRRK